MQGKYLDNKTLPAYNDYHLEAFLTPILNNPTVSKLTQLIEIHKSNLIIIYSNVEINYVKYVQT